MDPTEKTVEAREQVIMAIRSASFEEEESRLLIGYGIARKAMFAL
jgi:hypothetical protein